MIPFTGQTLNTGHFLQPTAIATGQSVISGHLRADEPGHCRPHRRSATIAARYPFQPPTATVTQGIVSAAAGVHGDPLKVQITNPIQIGNSGGPRVDQAGNVVGVVAGKLNPIKLLDLTGALPQNVNFAIKLEAVTEFLSTARVPFQRSSARDPVAGVELVRDARRYTVLIECQA